MCVVKLYVIKTVDCIKCSCEIVVETPNLSPSIPNPESNGTSKSNVAKDVDAQDNCRILHISVIQVIGKSTSLLHN